MRGIAVLVSLSFPSRKSAQVARRTFARQGADKSASYNNRARVDGRSAVARAIRRRVQEYSSAIGAAAGEPAVKARIVELAEIETLVTQLRANALLGTDVDMLGLSRLQGLARRLRQSLGLDAPPSPEEQLPSLEELGL